MMRGMLLAGVMLCSGFFPLVTHAATLYLEPNQGTFGPGDTFVEDVRIDTNDECINAAKVVLTYPKDALRAVDVGRGGSIFTLWVEEPVIDTEKGTITFAGGMPGGYCGQIQGDPGKSTMLARVAFTVLRSARKDADVAFSSGSEVYLNDGMGNKATLTTKGMHIALAPDSLGKHSSWVSDILSDKTPPEAFDIDIQSTKGVFNGAYYIVFSTIDKQSGIDHYEISERDGWHRVTSPYVLRDQSMRGVVQVKAIDKAGNERLGMYHIESIPPSQSSHTDAYLIMIGLIAIIFIGGAKIYIDRRLRKNRDLTKGDSMT